MSALRRPGQTNPATAPIDASAGAQRIATATAALALTLADRATARGAKDAHAAAAAGRRVRAARARLVRAAGMDQARRIEAALDLDRGRLLAAIGSAAPTTRTHAVNALAIAGSLAAAAGLTDAHALATLARSVRWTALAEAALDALLGVDVTTAADSSLLRLADRASAQARTALGDALEDTDEELPMAGVDPVALAELHARNARRDAPPTPTNGTPGSRSPDHEDPHAR